MNGQSKPSVRMALTSPIHTAYFGHLGWITSKSVAEFEKSAIIAIRLTEAETLYLLRSLFVCLLLVFSMY